MSKKKKAKRPSGRVKKTSRPGSGSPRHSLAEGWYPVRRSDHPAFRKWFLALAGLGFLALLLLALNSGVNGDDYYQADYSEALTDYFTGQNDRAVEMEGSNLPLYGGLFDLLAGMTNRLLGLDQYDLGYHRVRHVWNALFGMACMLFVGLTAREIGGWRTGFWALLLAFLSPRLFGHALMNPKDIPFAAGFAMSLFFLFRILQSMPRPDWRDWLGLTFGMGIAFGTRAGGLLLFGYTGLFLGLDFLARYGFNGLFSRTSELLRYVYSLLIPCLGAYVLGVLTWPAALSDPLGHPFRALSEFSQFGVQIRVLFQGKNFLSDQLPWYYGSWWILKTTPLVVLGGGLLLLGRLRGTLRRFSVPGLALMAFSFLFPLLYIIFKDSSLYDGWRQLLFVYPGLLVLSAVGWESAHQWTQKRESRLLQTAPTLVLAIGLLLPASFIVRNPSFPYVYFNPIGGGLKGALGWYETDYWGLSMRPAIRWMEREGRLAENPVDTPRIATTFEYNLSRQLGDLQARSVYVRINSRYTKSWKYGLFPSRFLRGPTLQSGHWPGSKAVHVVRANGVPLLAIERDTTGDIFRAFELKTAGNYRAAIPFFQAEVERHPDNSLAWQGLAECQLNTNQLGAALVSARKGKEMAPGNEVAHLYLGLVQLRMGQYQAASATFEGALELNPDMSIGYYYLGMVYKEQNFLNPALEAAQRSVELSPGFQQGYFLIADIYQESGDLETAARYRQMGQQVGQNR